MRERTCFGGLQSRSSWCNGRVLHSNLDCDEMKLIASLRYKVSMCGLHQCSLKSVEKLENYYQLGLGLGFVRQKPVLDGTVDKT